MKGKPVTPFASLLLISSLPLAGSLLAQDRRPAYPPQQQAPYTPAQATNQADVKTFAGKISKNNGKYVLEDPGSKTRFALDDQKTARKYDGKSVVVTGSLDESSNTIHVQKIEAAA
jgi:Protein of unknown function (DUF5818)